MFDSHCHLDFAGFDGDREGVWQAARAAGVTGVVVPGYAPSGWARLMQVAHGLDGAHAALGIHPWALGELGEGEVEQGLGELPTRLQQGAAVAVGECGLDGVVAKRGGAPLDRQREVCAAQLRVASTLALPVILHVVRAHGAALEVLREAGPLPAGGVLHSYGGSAELVREYAALGLCFSFSPAVLRPEATRLRRAACAVPLERLLVESDGPDQSVPDQPRGEPRHVADVCACLAELRGEAVAQVREQTAANARALFRL